MFENVRFIQFDLSSQNFLIGMFLLLFVLSVTVMVTWNVTREKNNNILLAFENARTHTHTRTHSVITFDRKHYMNIEKIVLKDTIY